MDDKSRFGKQNKRAKYSYMVWNLSDLGSSCNPSAWPG